VTATQAHDYRRHIDDFGMGLHALRTWSARAGHPVEAAMKKPDWFLVCTLCLLVFSKGLVWISIFPVWKIADEPAHFDHVQYRAENHRAPVWEGRALEKVIGPGASPEVRLSWTATLAYWRHRYLQGASSVPEEDILRRLALQNEGRRTDGQMPALHYPGLYYRLATLPYLALQQHSVLDRVFALRMLSLLFGLIATLATFGAARLACRSVPLAFSAAVFVALHPVASLMTAAVNNDAAVFGMGTLAYYFQMKVLVAENEQSSWWMGIALALTMALALMTKPQAFALLPGFAAVLLHQLSAAGFSARAWRFVGIVMAVFLLSYLPTIGELFTAIKGFDTLYDDGLDLPSGVESKYSFVRWLLHLDPKHLRDLFDTFWGKFGWMEYGLDESWFRRIISMGFAVLIGLVAAVGIRTVQKSSWWSGRALALAAGTVIAGVLFVLYVEYYAKVGLGCMPGHDVVQGRNLLFLLPPIAILTVVGLGGLLPNRLRPLAAILLVLATVCLHVASIIRILEFHYVG
jgi:hypothetical protein